VGHVVRTGKREIHTKVSWRNTKKTDPLEELDVEGRYYENTSYLQKRASTVFIWIKIRISNGFL